MLGCLGSCGGDVRINCVLTERVNREESFSVHSCNRLCSRVSAFPPRARMATVTYSARRGRHLLTTK